MATETMTEANVETTTTVIETWVHPRTEEVRHLRHFEEKGRHVVVIDADVADYPPVRFFEDVEAARRWWASVRRQFGWEGFDKGGTRSRELTVAERHRSRARWAFGR